MGCESSRRVEISSLFSAYVFLYISLSLSLVVVRLLVAFFLV